MHTDELNLPLIDPELDIPFEELALDDLPSLEEVLRISPTVLSSPPTAAQTLFSQRISIRINHGVLVELKKRAAAVGEKYQTYINQILAQHAGTPSAICKTNSDFSSDRDRPLGE